MLYILIDVSTTGKFIEWTNKGRLLKTQGKIAKNEPFLKDQQETEELKRHQTDLTFEKLKIELEIVKRAIEHNLSRFSHSQPLLIYPYMKIKNHLSNMNHFKSNTKISRDLLRLGLIIIMLSKVTYVGAQWTSLSVSGFNNDIVANGAGTGTAMPGVTYPALGVDGGGYSLIDNTYQWINVD